MGAWEGEKEGEIEEKRKSERKNKGNEERETMKSKG